MPDHVTTTLRTITDRLVDGPGELGGGAVLELVLRACGEHLGTAATGVLLVDPRGGVQVFAASDERAQLVELLQTQVEQGPAVECVELGDVVSVTDLRAATARWPLFTPAAIEAGYLAVSAVPMRLGGRVVGGLNLLYATPTEPTDAQWDLARLFADLAVLGLSQERDTRRAQRLAERTLTALNDRVHLGQAVGLVAATLDLDPDAARVILRQYTEQHHLSARDLARALTDGTMAPADLVSADQDAGAQA